MASGNIDVGKQPATRKAGQPAVNAGSSERRINLQQGGNCGAMSQQRCDSGNESAPQKFVQLVGYRNPKNQLEPVKR